MFGKIIVTCCILHILNADDPLPQYESQGTKKSQTKGLSGADRSYSWGATSGRQSDKQCLTGYMTDVQDWVDEYGNLNSNLDSRKLIDVSSKQDIADLLQERMKTKVNTMFADSKVKYLSMSKCKLKRVPSVFELTDRRGRALSATVEYLTLYGNDFATATTAAFSENMNATNAIQFSDVDIRWLGSSTWAAGFSEVTFSRLRELDLRKCNIQHLTDYIFIDMPMLEALYLGENQISFVTARAFARLFNLKHIDLSRNYEGTDEKSIMFEHNNALNILPNLQSIDFSKTLMSQQDIHILKDLRNLTRLSICYAGLVQLPDGLFKDSPLKYLDVSGNIGILSNRRPLEDVRKTLKVIYAKEIGLKTFEIFRYLDELEIIDIESNEVNAITSVTTKSLRNLQILNLNKNRLTTWFDMTYSYMKELRLLSIKENNINMISTEMIEDMYSISYIALSGNFFVCNCHTREFFEIAYRNENKTKPNPLGQGEIGSSPFNFHRGFIDFNALIETRKNMARVCHENKSCQSDDDIDADGDFLLLDFEENLYQCLQITEAKALPFSDVKTCPEKRKEPEYLDLIEESRVQLIVLIVIPVLVLPIMIFCYVFRRNLKYFWITIRNSVTLSMLNNKDVIINDDTIFHYDVFVSYCNDDRNWVLDELLPNIERECNISVCLHERDFQVGISILENIVACMDRSRSIMLLISKQFLLSQWCQFEMHLAQHRLLETRREDLILVLLEDIPRRLRPTTLHYLMLTKTYIVWPKKDGEHPAFWKRLSKSILSRRHLSLDNISLA